MLSQPDKQKSTNQPSGLDGQRVIAKEATMQQPGLRSVVRTAVK
jgi:hypothetical protein